VKVYVLWGNLPTCELFIIRMFGSRPKAEKYMEGFRDLPPDSMFIEEHVIHTYDLKD